MNIETEAFALNDYFNKIVLEYKKISKRSTSYQTNSYLKEEANNLYKRIQDFRAKYHLFIKERKNTFGKFNVNKYVEFYKFKNRSRIDQKYQASVDPRTAGSINSIGSQGRLGFVHMNGVSGLSKGYADSKPEDLERYFGDYVGEKKRGTFPLQGRTFEKGPKSSADNLSQGHQVFGEDSSADMAYLPLATETNMGAISASSGPVYTDQKVLEWRDEQYDSRKKRKTKNNKTLEAEEHEVEKVKMDMKDLKKKTEELYREHDYRKHMSLFSRDKELTSIKKNEKIFIGFELGTEDLKGPGLDNEQLCNLFRKCDLFLSEVTYLSCMLACSKSEKTLTCEDIALIMKTTNNIDLPGFPISEGMLHANSKFKEISNRIQEDKQNVYKSSRI